MFIETGYDETSTGIGTNDILVCYSDGLSAAENANGEQFSKSQIARVTQIKASESLQEIYDAIFKASITFKGRKDSPTIQL